MRFVTGSFSASGDRKLPSRRGLAPGSRRGERADRPWRRDWCRPAPPLRSGARSVRPLASGHCRVRLRPPVRAGCRGCAARDDPRQHARLQSRPDRTHDSCRRNGRRVRAGAEHPSLLRRAGCLGSACGDLRRARHQVGRRHRQPHRSMQAPAGDRWTLSDICVRSHGEQFECQGTRPARRKPDSRHGRPRPRDQPVALPGQDRRPLRGLRPPRRLLVRPRVLHECGRAAGPSPPGLVLRPGRTARRRRLRRHRHGVPAGQHAARGAAEGGSGRPRRHACPAGRCRRPDRDRRRRHSHPGELEPGQSSV